MLELLIFFLAGVSHSAFGFSENAGSHFCEELCLHPGLLESMSAPVSDTSHRHGQGSSPTRPPLKSVVVSNGIAQPPPIASRGFHKCSDTAEPAPPRLLLSRFAAALSPPSCTATELLQNPSSLSAHSLLSGHMARSGTQPFPTPPPPPKSHP